MNKTNSVNIGSEVHAWKRASTDLVPTQQQQYPSESLQARILDNISLNASADHPTPLPLKSGQIEKISVSQKHYERFDVDGKAYAECYTKVLPIEKILEREYHYSETHIPAYSACYKSAFLTHLVTTELISLLFPDDEHMKATPWLSPPLDQPPGQKRRYPDMPTFREAFEADGGHISDNHAPESWFLICATPYLFGNILYSSEESSLDFYWDNKTVNNLTNEKDHLRKLLDQFNVYRDDPQKQNHLLNVITKSYPREPIENVSEQTHGVMMQIMVPLSEVNKAIYCSVDNGVPLDKIPLTPEGVQNSPSKSLLKASDKTHLKKVQKLATTADPLTSLLALRQEEGTIKRHETMPEIQLRIYHPRLLDPKVNGNYKVFVYSDIKEVRIKKFRDNLRKILEKALNLPTSTGEKIGVKYSS